MEYRLKGERYRQQIERRIRIGDYRVVYSLDVTRAGERAQIGAAQLSFDFPSLSHVFSYGRMETCGISQIPFHHQALGVTNDFAR